MSTLVELILIFRVPENQYVDRISSKISTILLLRIKACNHIFVGFHPEINGIDLTFKIPVILMCSVPDCPKCLGVGHSLGAMANIMAMEQLQIHPKQMISIAPLIDLGKKFEASMDALDIPKAIQHTFFKF